MKVFLLLLVIATIIVVAQSQCPLNAVKIMNLSTECKKIVGKNRNCRDKCLIKKLDMTDANMDPDIGKMTAVKNLCQKELQSAFTKNIVDCIETAILGNTNGYSEPRCGSFAAISKCIPI